jgi:nicotinate phosphoribosyltransferase
MLLGIPAYGTVAHSWIMSFDDELDAFRSYQRTFPSNAVLLIDTYDTVRKVLDEAGFQSTQILASGDLNELLIDEMIRAGAAIDAFGVGTELTTVRDAPSLSVVYKLVELEENGVTEMKMKLSAGKSTYPGRKQVWRHSADGEGFVGDTVALAGEPPPGDGARPLLEELFANGKLQVQPPTMRDAAEHATRCKSMLPEAIRDLPAATEPYPVRFSLSILAEQDKLRREHGS